MKKYIIFFALVILLPLSFNVARAEQCTAPTPPVHYTTVPVYQNVGQYVDGIAALEINNGMVLLSDGRYIPMPTKQVQIDASKEPTYQADLLSYSICQQSNLGVKTYCFAPVKIGCTTENDYGVLASQGAMAGRGASAMTSVSLSACRGQINDYNAQMSTYNSCLSNQNKQSSYAPSAPVPSVIIPQLGSCQDQHGVHSVERNGNCTCPLIGYEWDSAKQCVSSIPDSLGGENVTPSLNTLDIYKAVGQIFQTYYPNDVDLLNKAILDYNKGQMDQSMKVFSETKKAFERAKDDSLKLNNTYKNQSLTDDDIGALYDLKTSATTCYLTAVIMLSGDKQGVGVTTGIKKCNDWSTSTDKLLQKILGVKYITSFPTQEQIAFANEWLVKKAADNSISSQKTVFVPKKEHSALAKDKSNPTKDVSTSTIIDEPLASSTPETPKIPVPHKAPIQKHWYQWLNPFSWFK